MEVNSLILNINSGQAEALGAFYRDTVQLPVEPGMGDNAFKVGGNAVLIIDGHSEISGPTKEPARMLVNLIVDDLDAEESRLEAAGVKFIRSKGVEYWGGVISTFLDPDGNYIQLIAFKPQG